MFALGISDLLRVLTPECTSPRREPRILENHSERRASTIRERIRPTLPIVHDESADGHGLHCPSENSDSGVINTGTESRDPVH